MADLWTYKNILPMLIAETGEPFDDPDYLFELKFDGERCLLYADPNQSALQNRRLLLLSPKFPELADLHRRVRVPCILDGELVVLRNGKPDFEEIVRRSLMSNRIKVEFAAKQAPATYIAFDILYYQDELVTGRPLTERKKLLKKAVRENERIAISRTVEEKGRAFFEAAKAMDLEGIVAKRKDSPYIMGTRSKDWIKIKNLQDDDFFVCGYIHKTDAVTSLALGQYEQGSLVYRGHVTMGVRGDGFRRILRQKPAEECPFAEVPKGNEEAVWLSPELVCTVSFMERSAAGFLRHPVFKGLRTDKGPG